MEYLCSTCGMSVKGLACAKCNDDLLDHDIAIPEGKSVKVSKCPNGHGQIKSPMCCGHDMTPKT